MMTSVMRLSSNRSYARTNQNGRITGLLYKLYQLLINRVNLVGNIEKL